MPVEIQELSADIAPAPRPEGGAEGGHDAPDAEQLAEQIARELATAERRRQRLSAD
jgi:hypothetical protein